MSDDTPRHERRSVLAALAGGSLSTLLDDDALARASDATALPAADAAAGTPDDRSVFPQGVASGDPTTDGIVLWTRIDPETGDADAPVRVEVAPDEDFADARAWQVPAGEVTAERDHTVKIDLAGELAPGETYAYRFAHDGARSPVGRCRTLPAADASPERLRFALLSCQDYRAGYYGAYRHVAAADLDFLLHLGDFIYEHGGPSAYDGRAIELPSGEGVAMGLADYRYLHRTYRSDPHLQTALARHPLIAIWDDHEVVNNRYWSYVEERPYAGRGDHPRNDDAAFMRQLFADGVRAWWEYTPARVRYDPEADSLLDQVRLYRSFAFGDLVDLVVTDQRLYRSSPAGGAQVAGRVGAADALPDLDETVLGPEQREWFLDRLADSEATWTAWLNEVLATDLQLDWGEVSLFNGDAWDGFESERERIMTHVREADVSNFVALTGDLHTAVAAYLHSEYDDDRARPDQRLGVEFATPAVTSANLRETLSGDDADRITRFVEAYARRNNPHVEYFNSHDWGYGVAEFTPEEATFSVYAVDKTTDPPAADGDGGEDAALPERRLLGRFRCPVGEYDLDVERGE